MWIGRDFAAVDVVDKHAALAVATDSTVPPLLRVRKLLDLTSLVVKQLLECVIRQVLSHDTHLPLPLEVLVRHVLL